jgi:hypothetical protein
LELFYFCELGAHIKFHDPSTTRSWLKVREAERKKRERKKMINSGHYVLPAMNKGSAHTPLGPKYILKLGLLKGENYCKEV